MISDGYGDGIRLSVFCSSLINWRRNFKISSLQVTDSATEMATYFFGGGKWRAGGGDGIKNPSLSETDFPSLDYKIHRPKPGKKI